MARHVPERDIRDLGDIRFASALEESLTPQPDYDVNRWLYVPCRYTEYRYILATRGQHPLICIGINPSTARPDALDRTLQSVERIALRNGYDSFVMFNVLAQRATDPNLMDVEFNETLHGENLRAFDWALSLEENPAVWAAWGTNILKRPYLAACLRDLAETAEKHGARWVQYGRPSKAGHPHHPLYLAAAAPEEPFDIRAYLASLPAQG